MSTQFSRYTWIDGKSLLVKNASLSKEPFAKSVPERMNTRRPKNISLCFAFANGRHIFESFFFLKK